MLFLPAGARFAPNERIDAQFRSVNGQFSMIRPIDPRGAAMPDVKELYRRALERFGRHVHQVRDDQWNGPTPCTEWDVRVLVNHLVSENLWMPPMLDGRKIADVGDRFDGDLLGE